MIRKIVPAAIAAAMLMSMLMSTQIASAGVLTFTSSLNGATEDPAVVTGGTGHATVMFDDVSNVLSVDVSFSGLTGLTAVAHIHCCTAVPNAGNVGVATALPMFPGGVSSGTYARTLDLTSAASFSSAFITASPGSTVDAARARLVDGLLAGKAYLNIHTVSFPAGEIRGFLHVPAPQTLSFAALLLLALPALRRRRTVARN